MAQTGSQPDADDVDRSTHFLFTHRVFQLKGARFALTDDGTRPAFHVDLGTLIASLPLGTVRGEFNIDIDSPDGILLAIVEKSLRFVKEIRPGDSIPRELLDGTASWSVEERHRLRAKAHLWAKALETDQTKGAKDAALTAFVEHDETQQKLKNVALRIADELGGIMDAETVLTRLDDLTRELAYIEALQERCNEILSITLKINQLARVYRADRAIVDELSRIRTLMLKPTELYNNIFMRLASRQNDMTDVIAHFAEQVEFVREQRDDVHHNLMLWDGILPKWSTIDLTRCTETETRITELYRFIARHFLTSQAWQQGAA